MTDMGAQRRPEEILGMPFLWIRYSQISRSSS